MKILIIDDEEIVAYSLWNFFQNTMGFHTFTAHDSFEALHFLIEDHFDLVICDYKMPDLDGIQIFEKMQNLQYKVPHFILMSGYFIQKTIEKAHESGIKYCLKKPIQIHELMNLIDIMTNQANMRSINEQ